tara:strand:+ start:96 stop:389 length:294 start_codon:yes stop_codon:yes gene_type:complete
VESARLNAAAPLNTVQDETKRSNSQIVNDYNKWIEKNGLEKRSDQKDEEKEALKTMSSEKKNSIRTVCQVSHSIDVPFGKITIERSSTRKHCTNKYE